jgi:hypothetical protein
MQLQRENFCPLLKKECVGLKCAWFIKVEGYDINSGKQVDEWNCAMSWLPMLLIENSGQQRQTGAAVESFRNEMVKTNQEAPILLAKAIAQAVTQSSQPTTNMISLEDNQDGK